MGGGYAFLEGVASPSVLVTRPWSTFPVGASGLSWRCLPNRHDRRPLHINLFCILACSWLKLPPTLRLKFTLILVVRCRKVTQEEAHQAWHRVLGAYALACSWLKLPPTLRLTLKLHKATR